MKPKNLIILFIFGVFLFLLPSFAEAACLLGCTLPVETGGNCYWYREGNCCERIGLTGNVTQIEPESRYCTTECEDTSGRKCKCNAFFPGSNGVVCTARDRYLSWLTCYDCSATGNWDYSGSQCVECSGKIENRILGNTSSVGDVCNDNFPSGNSKCESACGASSQCDEKTYGANVSVSGGVCNYCVFTPCECATDSDCGPLAYCSGEYLKDYDCADGCNCSGSYDCNDSNGCDNGAGDNAKKYRDYYCSTSGNDHCDYDLICKKNSCGAECAVDSDCPSGSICQSDCTCSGVCNGDIDVYPENDTEPCDYTIDIYNVDNCQGLTWRVERNGSYVSSGTVGSNDNWSKTLSDDNLDADSYNYVLKIDGDEKDSDSVTCSGVECTGDLDVSISGSGTCTVTAKIYPSGCSSESYRIKEEGVTKWSGTLSGDTTITRTGTVGVGSDYDYDLEFYIDGSWVWQDDDLNNVCSETPNNPPTCDAGSDKTVDENQSVQLDCSASDPDGDSLTYSWSCTGGSLNNSSILQPTYTAPLVTVDTNYTCTLNVDDGKGGNCSDSMIVHVKDVPEGVSIVPPVVITIANPTVSEDPNHPGKYRAILTGFLDSLGFDPGACSNCKCIVWFEWGTSGTKGVSGSYGNNNTPIEMTTEDDYFYYTADNLDPGTNYKFEAFAKNGGSW